MENRPIIKKEQVETVYDSRFIKVFDLQYEPGKHYFDATRRSVENLAAVKNDEEFKQMLPDAVYFIYRKYLPHRILLFHR